MNLKVLQLQSAHLGALITKATGETSTRGDLVAKLVEEVGELSKASRLHGRRKFGRPDAEPGTADAVLDELGDCLFLLGRLADAHGIDAEMAGEHAVAKVIERITTARAGDRGALIDLPQGDEDDGPPFFWAGAAMDNMERARELVLEGRLADAIHLWGAALAQLTVALERTVGGDMHALIDTRTFPVYGLGFQVLITQDRTTPGWAREEITRGAVDLISSINRKVSKEEAREDAHAAAVLALLPDRPLHLGPPTVCHLCAREIKLGPTTIWGPAWRTMAGPTYEVHQVCADLEAEGTDPKRFADQVHREECARIDAEGAAIAAQPGTVTIAGFNGDDLRAAMELEARFNLAECHRRDLAKAINQKGAAAVAAELAADIANMERVKAGGQVEVFLGVDHARTGAEAAYAVGTLEAATDADHPGHRRFHLVANVDSAGGVHAARGPIITPPASLVNGLHRAHEATEGTCWNCRRPFSDALGCEYCAGKGSADAMRKLITAASEATKPNGDPATMAELVKKTGMDPADVADLVETALDNALLFGDPKAVKLTDKGAALIGPAVPAPPDRHRGRSMAVILELLANRKGQPAPVSVLLDNLHGDMESDLIFDLLDRALKDGLLAGNYEGLTLTDKGAALIGAAEPFTVIKAPFYGPFKAGQPLLWFPREDDSRHYRVMVTEDFAGTNDMDAQVPVSDQDRMISARVSHLLTPEAWAEMIKPAPLAPLALKWGADMKKMLAIVDSEPERRGGVTHAETVAACGWLDGQQVTDLVDLALENALLTGDNQGLKLTDKGREVMTPAFGPFKAGQECMYFPGDWSSPHRLVKVRLDHPATNDILARVHVFDNNADMITARVLKLMTLAEYAEHFSE